MHKYYKIKFSFPKNQLTEFFSVKGNNKIEAIINANNTLIELEIDIPFEMIDEFAQIEYYESFKKDRYVDRTIFSIN